MRKIFLLDILLTISIAFMLLLTSCSKTLEPITDGKSEEEKTPLAMGSNLESVEIDSVIKKEEVVKTAEVEVAKKKEEAEKEAARQAEAERIAEEESINLIIEKNQDMIKELLMNPEAELKFINQEGSSIEQIWIQMSVFDFTGDGKNEIMLSKEYTTHGSWPISYNYVYDQEGNELFEFLGGWTGTMNIYVDKNSKECYLCGSTQWGEQNITTFYTKAVKHESWKKEVNIGVWDTRKDGQINTEESYCIFHISPEAEQDIFEMYYIKMAQIARTEELRVNEEELEEYLQSFAELEKEELDFREVILYIRDEFIMTSDGKEKTVLWDTE